ncbi:enoyl-CoA hydratase/isomerase family protein [Kutzneria buriramensis]|uniref:2-(1,2-epoxy-1,2-dihydrophenyl)acetyl-CoA isomerase n=1 Tax=Kutzneria buriramensis TaxID=1045776 RepID=A0A3E0HQV5_9PSEU|nr:enoyl-CoA hydratase-related protein [Kutzneria buriramensis]REH48616.1 2-(1,2-epoxy-1,2-dihydrophenyl)acetyl-CoA isomerase [Kutzneria buriramensis]
MDGETVSLDVDGAVATITLDAQATRNALTVSMKEALLAAVRRAADDESVRAVVLTGSGKAFCAGQDLAEHASALRADAATALDTVGDHYNPIVSALAGMRKPVLAAVNGTCVGAGLGLALACDLRIAAESAKFATAFTGIGLTCDSGLSATLARAVGAARASELVLLGQPFTAAQALEWGVVGRVVPDASFADEVRTLASKLANGPTVAYAEAKAALAASFQPPLADVLAAEAAAQTRLGLTADHQGAVESFLAKRPVEFHGK